MRWLIACRAGRDVGRLARRRACRSGLGRLAWRGRVRKLPAKDCRSASRSIGVAMLWGMARDAGERGASKEVARNRRLKNLCGRREPKNRQFVRPSGGAPCRGAPRGRLWLDWPGFRKSVLVRRAATWIAGRVGVGRRAAPWGARERSCAHAAFLRPRRPRFGNSQIQRGRRLCSSPPPPSATIEPWMSLGGSDAAE